jgi:hypothetical protein
MGDPLAVGDVDDFACAPGDEWVVAPSFTRPLAIEPLPTGVEGDVLRWGMLRLGVVTEGTSSDGSDSAPNGEETFGLDSDGRPGNDSPLRGRDEPVEGVALPEEDPALLEVGNVGVVTLGSAVPVVGSVGTASSGTPMSPNGM